MIRFLLFLGLIFLAPVFSFGTLGSTNPSLCNYYFAHQEKYPTLRMSEGFFREDRHYYGAYYLTEKEMPLHRIEVREGKLVWPDGTLVDTQTRDQIFVMDGQGAIFSQNPKHLIRGKVHHSTFLAGGPVATPGSFVVKGGVVSTVDNISGHYKPPVAALASFRDELKAKGAPVEQIDFYSQMNTKVEPKMDEAGLKLMRNINVIRNSNRNSLMEMPVEKRAQLLKEAMEVDEDTAISYQGNRYLYRARVAPLVWETEIPWKNIYEIFENPDPEVKILLLSQARASSAWRKYGKKEVLELAKEFKKEEGLLRSAALELIQSIP